MTNELLITFAGLYVIMVVRYLAISGTFYWLFWMSPWGKAKGVKLQKTDPKPDVVRAEIKWSLISTVIYAIPGAIMLEAWKNGQSAIYNDVSDYPLVYLPISLLLYMFLHDTYFYWTHRLMHLNPIYKYMHQVHHYSRTPTPWAAFSFHYSEAIVGAIFVPALVFIVPIHIGVLLTLLTIMTACAVINHNGVEFLPTRWLRGFVGSHLITATHHNHHHQYFNCNYGLYFRFWDKIMGTDRLNIRERGETDNWRAQAVKKAGYTAPSPQPASPPS